LFIDIDTFYSHFYFFHFAIRRAFSSRFADFLSSSIHADCRHFAFFPFSRHALPHFSRRFFSPDFHFAFLLISSIFSLLLQIFSSSL